MRHSGFIKHNLTLVCVAIAALTLALLNTHARADKTYIGPDNGFWTTASNWSPSGKPGPGDNVNVAPTSSLTVVYDDNSFNPAFNSVNRMGNVTIDGSGGATASVNESTVVGGSGTIIFAVHPIFACVNETIGNSGEGAFAQAGQTHDVNDSFTLGAMSGSSGSYTLSDEQHPIFGFSQGVFHVVFRETIGDSGTGSFMQTGGTNTVDEELWIGAGSGGNGTYTLASGTLTTNESEMIVGLNGTGTFTQSGGTVSSATQIELGLHPGSKGTYNLSNTGRVSAFNQETIGTQGTGVFNQTGGVNSTANVIVGDGGAYNLMDGSLTIGALLSIVGRGSIVQKGGTAVTEDLQVGEMVSSTSNNSVYTLSGGSIFSSSEEIGTFGKGTFNQTAGNNVVTHALTITPAGAGADGSYNLSGGELSAGSIINNGSFSYSGGSLTGDFTNNKNVMVSGGGIRVFHGNVTNNSGATFKTTNAIAKFTGTFTNHGVYHSDPSDNFFTSLDVASDGYLVGGAGDRFLFSQDLINQSIQSALWDTLGAQFIFQGGVSHILGVGGADLGRNPVGFIDNFALGSLSLGSGDSLVLQNERQGSNAALYVEQFLLADGIAQLADIKGNGVRIYYNPLDPANSYLNGKDYAFSGGGGLFSDVPEPGAAAWPGLFACSLLRWRRNKP